VELHEPGVFIKSCLYLEGRNLLVARKKIIEVGVKAPWMTQLQHAHYPHPGSMLFEN
jgi:hypothetical protein